MEGDPFAIDDSTAPASSTCSACRRRCRRRARVPRLLGPRPRRGEGRRSRRSSTSCMERRAEHPDLHVYHYAPYETTAVKRLMGAHHTREAEVDELLRAEVFVDLYAVVRAARAHRRRVVLVEAGRAPLPGARRRRGDERGRQHRRVRGVPRRPQPGDASTTSSDYNEDDCRSTLELHDWLEERRADAEAQCGPIPRPRRGRRRARGGQRTRGGRRRPVRATLLADAPDDEQQARWLLAQMLDWHRREAKPDWWMYFARQQLSDEELVRRPRVDQRAAATSATSSR